jgi:hypothetical protein
MASTTFSFILRSSGLIVAEGMASRTTSAVGLDSQRIIRASEGG